MGENVQEVQGVGLVLSQVLFNGGGCPCNGESVSLGGVLIAL